MARSPDSAVLADDDLAAAMHAELGSLLDAVPHARKVLPYLAVLENGLREQKLPFIDALPVSALEKTTRQLSSLPPPREGSPLAQLAMFLDLELQDRQQHRSQASAAPFLSSFLTDEKLSVSDASHSDFMRALGDEPVSGGSR